MFNKIRCRLVQLLMPKELRIEFQLFLTEKINEIKRELEYILESNGIPLPKGHGRILDEKDILDTEKVQIEKSCDNCNNYDKRNGCDGDYDYMCECTDNEYKHWKGE